MGYPRFTNVNEVVIVGGFTTSGQAMGNLIFDPVADVYRPAAPLPNDIGYGSFGGAILPYEDSFLYIGGSLGGPTSDAVFSFVQNNDEGSWKQMPNGLSKTGGTVYPAVVLVDMVDFQCP